MSIYEADYRTTKGILGDAESRTLAGWWYKLTAAGVVVFKDAVFPFESLSTLLDDYVSPIEFIRKISKDRTHNIESNISLSKVNEFSEEYLSAVNINIHTVPEWNGGIGSNRIIPIEFSQSNIGFNGSVPFEYLIQSRKNSQQNVELLQGISKAVDNQVNWIINLDKQGSIPLDWLGETVLTTKDGLFPLCWTQLINKNQISSFEFNQLLSLNKVIPFSVRSKLIIDSSSVPSWNLDVRFAKDLPIEYLIAAYKPILLNLDWYDINVFEEVMLSGIVKLLQPKFDITDQILNQLELYRIKLIQ